MVTEKWEIVVQDLIVRGKGFSLEPFSTSDLSLLSTLHAKSDANRFLSRSGKGWSQERTSEWLEKALIDQDRHGFSPFKLALDDQSFAGWAGFTALEETSEIALHYCIDPDVQELHPELLGKVSAELIEWFFETTYFSHLVDCVRTDDRDGRILAQSLGFSYRESRRIFDMPCDVFQRLSPSMQTLVASA